MIDAVESLALCVIISKINILGFSFKHVYGKLYNKILR